MTYRMLVDQHFHKAYNPGSLYPENEAKMIDYKDFLKERRERDRRIVAEYKAGKPGSTMQELAEKNHISLGRVHAILAKYEATGRRNRAA